jgi:hypothetical protein
MIHSSTPNAFLFLVRSSSSTFLPSPFVRGYHTYSLLRPALPPSRQIHDHPSSHLPRGDQPPASPPPISTVNDAEIAHFSRLSALWWDERGEFALLHKMNPHRMRFIREKVLEVRRSEQQQQQQLDDDNDAVTAAVATRPKESSRVLEGMDVLDVGCGGGILSEVAFSPILPPAPLSN